jgi:hypothetical protein
MPAEHNQIGSPLPGLVANEIGNDVPSVSTSAARHLTPDR